MQAPAAHEPEHLLAQQQLQALEEELAGGVARELFALGAAALLFPTDDAALLAEVVVLVDVELDVALGGWGEGVLVCFVCLFVCFFGGRDEGGMEKRRQCVLLFLLLFFLFLTST